MLSTFIVFFWTIIAAISFAILQKLGKFTIISIDTLVAFAHFGGLPFEENSTEVMAGNEAEMQSEVVQPVQPPSPVFSMLPIALQIGLHPFALVRRGLSNYSLRSRNNVTSLVMFGDESEEVEETEDATPAEDETVVSGVCSPDSAEVPGICWKFARHGKILPTETIRHETDIDDQAQISSRLHLQNHKPRTLRARLSPANFTLTLRRTSSKAFLPTSQTKTSCY